MCICETTFNVRTGENKLQWLSFVYRYALHTFGSYLRYWSKPSPRIHENYIFMREAFYPIATNIIKVKI